MRIASSALVFLMLVAAGPTIAAETGVRSCRADSPPFRAAVIELYTSQGCNSCPPADAWLRQLPRADLESGRVVPLALHVDYWNYLGWSDPFSKSQFTARQRALAARANARTIYTPGFFLNGREWRGRQRDELGARLAALAAEQPAARIELRASAQGNRLRLHGSVHWRAADPGRAVLYLAVTESGLSQAVGRGENAGRTLHHDHVVRYLSDGIALPASPSEFDRHMTLDASWSRARLDVAAFIEDRASGAIVQAVRLARCLS